MTWGNHKYKEAYEEALATANRTAVYLDTFEIVQPDFKKSVDRYDVVFVLRGVEDSPEASRIRADYNAMLTEVCSILESDFRTSRICLLGFNCLEQTAASEPVNMTQGFVSDFKVVREIAQNILEGSALRQSLVRQDIELAALKRAAQSFAKIAPINDLRFTARLVIRHFGSINALGFYNEDSLVAEQEVIDAFNEATASLSFSNASEQPFFGNLLSETDSAFFLSTHIFPEVSNTWVDAILQTDEMVGDPPPPLDGETPLALGNPSMPLAFPSWIPERRVAFYPTFEGVTPKVQHYTGTSAGGTPIEIASATNVFEEGQSIQPEKGLDFSVQYQGVDVNFRTYIFPSNPFSTFTLGRDSLVYPPIAGGVRVGAPVMVFNDYILGYKLNIQILFGVTGTRNIQIHALDAQGRTIKSFNQSISGNTNLTFEVAEIGRKIHAFFITQDVLPLGQRPASVMVYSNYSILVSPEPYGGYPSEYYSRFLEPFKRDFIVIEGTHSLFLVNALKEYTLGLETGEFKTFEPCAFVCEIPAQDENGLPELMFQLDNVDKRIGDYINEIKYKTTNVIIKYRPYLASDTTQPQLSMPIEFSVSEIQMGDRTVSVRARAADIMNRAFLRERYVRRRFPSLGNA